MYTMKDVCEKTGLSYDTLKYYCNVGLIPNVKRDSNNYRVFDDDDLGWIDGLNCLKKCGMSLSEIKDYMILCMNGKETIPERKKILEIKRKELVNEIEKIQESINFIDWKQGFYDDIISGKKEYFSYLKKDV